MLRNVHLLLFFLCADDIDLMSLLHLLAVIDFISLLKIALSGNIVN